MSITEDQFLKSCHAFLEVVRNSDALITASTDGSNAEGEWDDPAAFKASDPTVVIDGDFDLRHALQAAFKAAGVDIQ